MKPITASDEKKKKQKKLIFDSIVPSVTGSGSERE
jgi:hypothetical protein